MSHYLVLLIITDAFTARLAMLPYVTLCYPMLSYVTLCYPMDMIKMSVNY